VGGGPATIDIWDLKPGRPTGGDFTEINTRVNGLRISQHMPRTAQQMNHLAVIRSLTTTEGDHNRGRQLMHTSYTPNPALQFPSIGSVAAHEIPKLQGYRDISLPSYVAVGGASDGPGFLGMNYAPFNVQNPGSPPENLLPSLTDHNRQPLNENDRQARIERRQNLFHAIEDPFTASRAPHLSGTNRVRFADASRAHSEIYRKGFSLVASRE